MGGSMSTSESPAAALLAVLLLHANEVVSRDMSQRTSAGESTCGEQHDHNAGPGRHADRRGWEVEPARRGRLVDDRLRLTRRLGDGLAGRAQLLVRLAGGGGD